MSSATSATTRPKAGDRVGTMGDDGEKFGGWPKTFEHCWGPTGWVERFFSRARGKPGLADHRHSIRMAGRARADRAGLSADGLLRGDGRVGPAGRRGARVRPRRQRSQGRGAGPRLAGCAARSGATSRSSTARSTTSTNRCSGQATSSRPCRAAAAVTPPATTCTPASRTIRTGTGCSAGSTCPTSGLRHSIA